MTQKSNANSKSIEITEKDLEVLQAIRSIKYGTVLIVINNSEVVQIESTNKRRFDLQAGRKQD